MYRCYINDPLKHDKHHIGKFYRIDESDYGRLDPSKTFLKQQFINQCKAFNETCLMIRNPSIEIINYLKNLDLSQSPCKFILYGNFEGTGRSSASIHVMHYCLRDNWLLFTVPKAGRVLRNKLIEIENSTYKPDRYDTPLIASEILKMFLAQNKPLLEKLNPKISKDYKWSEREMTKQGTSFLELLDFANNRVKYSSDIVGVLIKEIKLLANQKKVKVLVTINELNALYGPTRIYRTDRSMIMPDQVTIARNFKKLLKPDWTNAAIVGIVNAAGEIIPGPNRKKKHYDNSIDVAHRRRVPSKVHYEGPLTPKCLLKREGFYDLEPFIPVEVQKYSNEELTNHFEYYKDRQWIQNPLAREDEGREEIAFLSGRNPLEFMRVCRYL